MKPFKTVAAANLATCSIAAQDRSQFPPRDHQVSAPASLVRCVHAIEYPMMAPQIPGGQLNPACAAAAYICSSSS